MEKKYLKTEVDNHKYCDLADYVNKNNLRIEEDYDNYYLLSLSEKLVDGEIVDNSEEYNKKQQKDVAEREIAKLEQELKDSDYRVLKCYECFMLNLPLPYDIRALHEEKETKRAKINELEKLFIVN